MNDLSSRIMDGLYKMRGFLRICVFVCVFALAWQAGNISTKWRDSNITLGNVPASEFIDFTINIGIALYLLKKLAEFGDDDMQVILIKRAIREHESEKT